MAHTDKQHPYILAYCDRGLFFVSLPEGASPSFGDLLSTANRFQQTDPEHNLWAVDYIQLSRNQLVRIISAIRDSGSDKPYYRLYWNAKGFHIYGGFATSDEAAQKSIELHPVESGVCKTYTVQLTIPDKYIVPVVPYLEEDFSAILEQLGIIPDTRKELPVGHPHVLRPFLLVCSDIGFFFVDTGVDSSSVRDESTVEFYKLFDAERTWIVEPLLVTTAEIYRTISLQGGNRARGGSYYILRWNTHSLDLFGGFPSSEEALDFVSDIDLSMSGTMSLQLICNQNFKPCETPPLIVMPYWGRDTILACIQRRFGASFLSSDTAPTNAPDESMSLFYRAHRTSSGALNFIEERKTPSVGERLFKINRLQLGYVENQGYHFRSTSDRTAEERLYTTIRKMLLAESQGVDTIELLHNAYMEAIKKKNKP